MVHENIAGVEIRKGEHKRAAGVFSSKKRRYDGLHCCQGRSLVETVTQIIYPIGLGSETAVVHAKKVHRIGINSGIGATSGYVLRMSGSVRSLAPPFRSSVADSLAARSPSCR